MITTSDLSKRPAAVLQRVLRGERLIVCRHGRPVATLQPLDGHVMQPFAAREDDLGGSPLGSLDAAVEALGPVKRTVLLVGFWLDRYKQYWPSQRFGPAELRAATDEMKQEGLLRRIPGEGTALTGRGFLLREELLRRAGALERPRSILGNVRLDRGLDGPETRSAGDQVSRRPGAGPEATTS